MPARRPNPRKAAPAPAPPPPVLPPSPRTALLQLRTVLSSGLPPSSAAHLTALHLLSIVEHALPPPPPLRGIRTLATELLDAIAGHLERRRDVLAFGLSARFAWDVVRERHVPFREVRIPLRRVGAWTFLAAHAGLARNVRRAEVVHDGSVSFAVPDEEGAYGREALLRAVRDGLGAMSALTALEWAAGTAVVSFEDVAGALWRCEMLREVRVADNALFAVPQEDEDEEEVARCQSPELASVSFSTARNAPRARNKQPSLSRITHMLSGPLPNLTTLRVGYDHASARTGPAPRADELLRSGRWPGLMTLALHDVACGAVALGTFLGAHAALEDVRLRLTLLGPAVVDLPAGALPKLALLSAPRALAADILAGSASGGVHTLQGVRLEGGGAAFYGALPRSLRHVVLEGYSEMEDVRRLGEAVGAGLLSLDLGKRLGGRDAFIPNVNDWAPALSLLPRLVRLQGICFFYTAGSSTTHSMRSRVRKNDEVAALLAWRCPKLRFVDGRSGALGERKRLK